MSQSPIPARPIALFGEVLFDCFPDGRRVLGGAPFNVAWHLAAFGAAPRLISAVGDDADGAAVRAAMRAWGMDDSAVQTDPAHATGVVEVTLADGEPHYEILPARAFDHIRPVTLEPPPALLYHGTLALRGPVSAATLGQLQAATPKLLRVLDANLRDPWWSLDDALALIPRADWVKLSQTELARLTAASVPAGSAPVPAPVQASTGGGRLDEDALLAQAQAFARHYGLPGLVVTLGAQGLLALADGLSPLRLPAPPVPVPDRMLEPTLDPQQDRGPQPALVDTVGAGDALAAVLILGLTRGWALPLTLARALDFAARICAQRGATAADPDLYRAFSDAWGLGTTAAH